MAETTAVVMIFAGLIVLLAHLFSALFERTRIPDVLPLVLLGFAAGPLSGYVSAAAIGRAGHWFSTAALVIILFEGGVGLSLTTLRQAWTGAVRLTVMNVGACTVLLGLASAWLLDLEPLVALLLGVALSATSSAVVIPMVARLRMGQGMRTALVLESALTDVVCIVLSLALLEAHAAREATWVHAVGDLLSSLLLAGLVGGLAGLLWSAILHKVRELQNSIMTTPAFAFVVYGVTEMLGYSGAIAALVYGVMLGNAALLQQTFLREVLGRSGPIHLNDTEKAFFAEVVFIVKAFFFLYVGLSINIASAWIVFIGLVLSIGALLVRAPVARLALGRAVPAGDAALAAIMVPRGLVSAVLASLGVEAGISGSPVVRDVIYSSILFTILLTAVLSFLLEKGLLRQPYARIFRGYAAPAPEPQEPGSTD